MEPGIEQGVYPGGIVLPLPCCGHRHGIIIRCAVGRDDIDDDMEDMSLQKQPSSSYG